MPRLPALPSLGALRDALIPPPPLPDPVPPEAVVAALAERVAAESRARLGRSLALFHLDAGDCGGCALEIAALSGALSGLARHGLALAASPREADVLLVSGPVTRNMAEAARQAHAAMAGPRWVVAVGDCAADGGLFKGTHAVEGGAPAVLPVDLLVPGCPPPPAALLEGLLAVMAAQR